MELLYALDLLGTLVFAISGTLAGIQKRLDMFGALFTGFITAVGGGTIRDVLLGAYPVGWIKDANYLLVIVIGFLLAFVFTNVMLRLRNALFLFDTIGIGVFTIMGVQKALAYEVGPVVAVLMGAVSAVFGGALRDMFTNDIPLIFRKEIYAVACLIGGANFLLLGFFDVPLEYNELATASLVIVIRLVAVRFSLALPIHDENKIQWFVGRRDTK